MKELERICFHCSNSMVDDEDELFCVIHQKKVQEEETCENFN